MAWCGLRAYSVAVVLLSADIAGALDAADVEAKARAVEHRLMAPCCWQQTLDVHHSDLADALHDEIRARIVGGETAAAIEHDLVDRYGDRVIAVPSPRLLEGTAGTLLALVGLFGVWLVHLGYGWTRRASTPSEPRDEEADPRYDAALDDALDRLDER